MRQFWRLFPKKQCCPLFQPGRVSEPSLRRYAQSLGNLSCLIVWRLPITVPPLA